MGCSLTCDHSSNKAVCAFGNAWMELFFLLQA